jgi:hypothetical protein
MEKEFVPYEIALQLKELGFDEPCLKVGNPNGHIMWKWIEVDGYPPTVSINDIIQVHYSKVWIQIPTFSQAFRWFRDKHNLLNIIDCYIPTPLEWFIRIDKISNDSLDYKMDITEESEDKVYLTYEEAELACIIKLIEIVKTK